MTKYMDKKPASNISEVMLQIITNKFWYIFWNTYYTPINMYM